jgi:hypothetical protein
MLPGLGRVEAIKRQGGDWVVVTVRGIIAPVPSFRPSECNEGEREFITGDAAQYRRSTTAEMTMALGTAVTKGRCISSCISSPLHCGGYPMRTVLINAY